MTAQMTTVADGFNFLEAPRWRDGRLWFSDFYGYKVRSMHEDGSDIRVEAEVPGQPSGLGWLPDGRLLIVAGEELLVRTQDGTLSTYAKLGAVSTKPWNDIVSDGRGNTYLNNIGFDFPDGEFAPGLIALVSPDGTARQVAEGLAFPNGMAVTPDNSTLIVAESYGGVLAGYDIAPDGDLANRRVWAELDGAAPDGICVDAEGAVWFAEVPGCRCVRVREGGEVLQTITSELGCFACMLGGPEGTTLFVTAAGWPDAMTPGSRTGQILSAEVSVPHAGWPG